MIPVKDSAGGTAPVPEKETEGAEDKHADKIANVKGNRYYQDPRFINNSEIVEDAYNGGKRDPHKEYAEICFFCGVFSELFQRLAVKFSVLRLVAVTEILCRA